MIPIRGTKKSMWRIGEIMIQKTWIDWQCLSKVLSQQRHQRDLIGEMLVHQNRVTEVQVLRALAIQYGVPFIQLEGYPVEGKAVQSVSGVLAARYNFFPLEIGKKYLLIAVTTPYNYFLKAFLSELTGRQEIKFVCVSPEDLKKAIRVYYKGDQAVSF